MADLQFYERDPDKGYISNNLIIPKRVINLTAVRSALSFVIGEENIIDEDSGTFIGTRPKVHELWDETDHHIITPREFLSEKVRKDFEIEWIVDPLDLTRVKLPDRIVPRDETQLRALAAMHKYRGGTVNLACGRGKTVVALKYAVERKCPLLVVVNTSALLHQWLLEIKQHIGNVRVGQIQGDRFEWEGYPIVIATVQTLANRRHNADMNFRRYFGVVFFDEGHHLSAPHFVKTADMFFGERFSLTATATRTDGLESIYQYHLGRVIYSDLSQELIPQTVFHQLDWQLTKKQDSSSRDVNGQRHHGKLCIMLGTVDWRNRLIVRAVRQDIKEDRQVLVLTHSVEHSRELLRLYKEKGGKKAGLINGVDVPPEDRIPVLLKSNPVFGTFQLAREALNKQTLDTLIICTPFGNSNDLQQSWGRIQRMKEGKQNPKVRLYEDVQIPTCVSQCRRLRKFLKAMKYPATSTKELTK